MVCCNDIDFKWHPSASAEHTRALKWTVKKKKKQPTSIMRVAAHATQTKLGVNRSKELLVCWSDCNWITPQFTLPRLQSHATLKPNPSATLARNTCNFFNRNNASCSEVEPKVVQEPFSKLEGLKSHRLERLLFTEWGATSDASSPAKSESMSHRCEPGLKPVWFPVVNAHWILLLLFILPGKNKSL